MANFRFMDLDIWKESIEMNDKLFDLADKLSDAKSFRVAEQLRSAQSIGRRAQSTEPGEECYKLGLEYIDRFSLEMNKINK